MSLTELKPVVSSFTFGIYPGGESVNEKGEKIGRPDDPEQIQVALDQLQGAAPTFLVRTYRPYSSGTPDVSGVPANPLQYMRNGRKLDLVLQYRDPAADIAGWLNFVREKIVQYGPHIGTLQIAEEPNNYSFPGDGCFPEVRQAIVQGIVAAKRVAQELGYNFQVGFNAVLNFNPQDDFWLTIGKLGSADFHAALDYVALDFFPDAFRPIPFENLSSIVAAVLTDFRQKGMNVANISPEVPIHIAENGWPTGPAPESARTYEKQAKVLETIFRTIYAQRNILNITHYEHFDLRDALSSDSDIFSQFGIMQDDYTPKPAFETFRRLIAEVSQPLAQV